MQNPVLKLTVLAGVVGVGFLVVYQAQKGMMLPSKKIDAKKAFAELAGDQKGDPDGPAPQQPGQKNEAAQPDDPFAQTAAGASKPTDASAGQGSGLDFREDSTATAGVSLNAKSEATTAAKNPDAAADLFEPQSEPPTSEKSSNPEKKNAPPFDPLAGAQAKSNKKPAEAPLGEKRHKAPQEIQQANFEQDAPADAHEAQLSESGTPADAHKSTDVDAPKPSSEPVPLKTSSGPQLVSPTPRTAVAAEPSGVSLGPATDEPVDQAGRSRATGPAKQSETPPDLDSPESGAAAEPAKPKSDVLNAFDPIDSPADRTPKPDLHIPTQSKDHAKSSPPEFTLDDVDDGTGKKKANEESAPAANDKHASESKAKAGEPVLAHPADNSFNARPNDAADNAPSLELDAPGRHPTAPDKQEPKLLDLDPPARAASANDPATKLGPPSSAPATKAPAAAQTPTPAEPSDLDDTLGRPASKSASGPQILPGAPDVRIQPKGAANHKPNEAPDLPADKNANDQQPKRLIPTPEAAPLDAAKDNEKNNEDEPILGDGVVGRDDPSGPQQPKLVLEKLAPRDAVLGEPLIYNIVVKNVGNSPAHQVVVADQIPKGTKLSGTIPRAELVKGKLLWKLGTIKPSQSRKIAVRVVPVEEGQIGSVATVNFVAEVAARTVVSTPKIEVGMSAPKQVKVGDQVPLRFKVTNRGQTEAHKVVIRNIVPPQMKHPAGADLEFEMGTVPPGATREVSLTLTAAEAGNSLNRAVVTAEGGVAVETKSDVQVVGSFLVLTREGPTQRYAGKQATYTNKVFNKSNQPMYGVTVIERIPDGMEFVAASDGGQYDEGRRSVAWRIEQLQAGATAAIHIKLIPRTEGTQESTIVAVDPNGNKVTTTAQTAVQGFANVNLEIPALDGPLEVGQHATVRIVSRNKGTVAAKNVRVFVTLPPELEFASANGPSKHAVSGQEVIFEPVPQIGPQSAAMFDVEVVAKKRGDARLKVRIESDQLQPLGREESLLVLPSQQPQLQPQKQ